MQILIWLFFLFRQSEKLFWETQYESVWVKESELVALCLLSLVLFY